MQPRPNGWLLSLLALGFVAGTCYLVGAALRSAPDPVETPRVQTLLRADEMAGLSRTADDNLDEVVTAVASIHTPRDEPRPAAPGVRERDPDWLGYPRSRFRFTDWVIGLDPKLKPDALFRHVHLNTADAYIPVSERKELVALFATLKHKFKTLHTVHTALASREARAALGKTQHVELHRKRGRWMRSGPLKDLVLDGYRADPKDPMVLIQKGGELVGVRYRDLPATRTIVERKLFIASELGIALVQWFRARGLCPATTAENLLADLFNETEAQRRVARRPEPRGAEHQETEK